MGDQKTIKQAELAKQPGVSRAYISMVMNGKRKLSEELQTKLDMSTVNSHVHPDDLKSASREGVWVQVPPSALSSPIILLSSFSK